LVVAFCGANAALVELAVICGTARNSDTPPRNPPSSAIAAGLYQTAPGSPSRATPAPPVPAASALCSASSEPAPHATADHAGNPTARTIIAQRVLMA
jgi:hypothetical protein